MAFVRHSTMSTPARIYIIGLLLSLLNGCALMEDPAQIDKELADLEIFMARASLLGADFEHYRLSGSDLFFECGAINRGKFKPKQQEILSLPYEAQQKLKVPLARILDYSDEPQNLDPAGKANSFIDPGVFELDFTLGGKKVKHLTSVDQLTQADSRTASQMKKLTETLRKTVRPLTKEQTLCGLGEFYGIGGIR